MITQSDMNKSHGHVIGGNSQFQYVNLTYRDGSGLNIKGSNGTPDLPIQALSDGGIEARPVNISIKIWKRTN